MPKESYQILRFDGGNSTNPDPRDIDDNEASYSQNACVAEVGIIKLTGSASNISSPDWNSNIAGVSTITPGYGLYIFSVDYDLTNTLGHTNCLALGHRDSSGNSEVIIFDDSATQWGTVIQLETSAASPEWCFYFADGALRITDGNFSNSPTNKWWGYINRTHFSGLSPGGSADTYASWYEKDNTLTAPTRGLVTEYGSGIATGTDADTLQDVGRFDEWTAAQLDGKEYIAVNYTDDKDAKIISKTSDDEVETDSIAPDAWGVADGYLIFPKAGTGFNIYIVDSAVRPGEYMSGDYEFASSFIYDGNQESQLFEMSGGITVAADDSSLEIVVRCTSPFDPRISGGRIYIRETDSDSSWILLVDISLKDGCRLTLGKDYSAWALLEGYSGTNNFLQWPYGGPSTIIPKYSTTINPDTYEILNGFTPDQAIVADQWKTAAVVNRIAYIGNVKIDGQIYEDSIFKSYPNRFDTFTIDRRIDVAINDGDKVVKIEPYADRLLEFKERALHIINISQEVEFLEETKMFMGIKKPFQACQTEYGVCWCNDRGVYLYNGQQIVDLFIKDGIRRIAIDNGTANDWNSFYNETWTSVTYNPKEKRLHVVNNLQIASTKNLWIFDFVTYSWTVADYKYLSGVYSNYTNDWDGTIINYNVTNNNIMEWSDDAASTAYFDWETKDFSFGLPGVKKNLYKVYITYQSGGSATNVIVKYTVDGGTSKKNMTGITNADASGVLASASGWAVAELRPSTMSEARNKYSFKLHIEDNAGATVPSGFEINDITLIYRLMKKR